MANQGPWSTQATLDPPLVRKIMTLCAAERDNSHVSLTYSDTKQEQTAEH